MNQRFFSRVPALAFVALLLTPQAPVRASAPSQQAAVLRQEARWLAAIEAGDRETIALLLTANYKHVTSQGKLLDRAAELASVTKEPFTMHWTQQSLDFAGNVAVVHGLNVTTEPGKPTLRERYTDVYVNQNGSWMAMAAHETAIVP